jgi:hypothetical protein
MVNTEQETDMLEKILQRLAAMFPRQDYQSRLEQYIVSHNPKTTVDVEYYERRFNQQQSRGLL